MTGFRSVFVALLAGIWLSGSLDANGQDRIRPAFDVIKSVFEPWLAKSESPGAIVVIHLDGKSHFFPHGMANRERKVPVTPDSIFELASITKVFVTTSLAIEVEARRMRLSDHVVEYLPQLRTGGDIKHVTLEQLATHTSSLPRTPGAVPNGGWTQDRLLEWLQHWHAPHPPGTKSLYSNIGLGVLGQAIAEKEHKTLQAVLEQQFLHRLEMNSTFFEIPSSAAERLVQGYNPKNHPVNRALVNVGWPGGGRLCSSGKDMAKFLAANLGEDHRHPLISKAMQFAQQPHFKVSERMTQGLCWQRIHLNDQLVIDKNGGLAGTSTYIGFAPEKRIGVVVMVNRGKRQATAVGRQMIVTLLGGAQIPEGMLQDEDGEDNE